MTFESILNLLLNIQIWSLAKALVCFALFLYIIFAFVVVRQVSLMNDSINFSLGWLLKLVAALHFLGVIFVFVLAVLIL